MGGGAGVGGGESGAECERVGSELEVRVGLEVGLEVRLPGFGLPLTRRGDAYHNPRLQPHLDLDYHSPSP